MLSEQVLALDQKIRELKIAAEKVQQLAEGYPTAERNVYMVLRHVEMMEREICDVVTALEGGTGKEA